MKKQIEHKKTREKRKEIVIEMHDYINISSQDL